MHAGGYRGKARGAALALGLAVMTAAAARAQRPGSAGPGSDGSGGFAIDGALETITPDAVSVRASDGSVYAALLPPSGPLTASALAAGRQVGDEVTLRADFIPPRFIAADNQDYELQLSGLRFQRAGSGGSLRAALACPAWRVRANLLAPPPGMAPPAMPPAPSASPDAFLEAARAAVLRYAAGLPNFLVSESVTRTTRGRGTNSTDHVQSELAVSNGQEQRSQVRLNGEAWNHPFAQLPGLRWTSDFAEHLQPLFLPACGTNFQPAGRGQRHGTAVRIYHFRLAPSLCAGRAQAGPAWAYPGFAGTAYISTATQLVVRLEEHYTQLPAAFAERSSQDVTDWAPVEVAGAVWLLPSDSELQAEFRTGERVRLTVRYTQYRRFEASSHMTIVGPAPTPAAK